MGASARIDELRKRYDENPRRFFAPLANEYRKAGDLEQAIDLCRSHLADAPSNLSGQIVFGQALFESGAMDEARTAFALAVDLDPENLIALRHLGDIARIAGDGETAVTWYQRVLDADPRNDEIAELIQTAKATLVEIPPVAPPAPEPLALEPTSLAEAPSPVAPATEPELETTQIIEAVSFDEPLPEVVTLGFDEPETVVESLSFDEPEPTVESLSFDAAEPVVEVLALDASEPEPDTSSFDNAASTLDVLGFDGPDPVVEVLGFDTAEPDVEMLTFDDPEPMVASSPPAMPVVADTATDFGASAFPDATFDELGFDTPSPIEVPAEDPLPPLAVSDVDFGVVDLPPADTVAAEPVEWTSWGEATAASSSESAAAPEPVAEPEPEPTPEPAPEPFATETMAQLYLRQGLRTEAIAVYRQLIEARPDDAGLRAALAAIESPAAAEPAAQGPTARAFFGALSARRAVPTRTLADTSAPTVIIPAMAPPTASEALPAPAVRPSGALDALFGNGTVSGADEHAAEALAAAFGAAESAPAGRPSQPAATDLSLDQVFRTAAPTPPRPSLAVPRQSASIRFDQFFASPESAAPTDGAAPEAPPPDPGSSDAQFQDWLSGLKRT